MQITDVRIKKMEDGGKLKAIVSITLDDMFAIHDLKVIEGVNGNFIAMPSRKIKDGEFRDIAHPINNEMRSMLEKAIYEAYEKEASPAHEAVSENEATE